MSLNLLSLRPFEAKDLSKDLEQGNRIAEFGKALKTLLSIKMVDPASEGDYIRATAVELNSAGVFDKLDPKAVKSYLRDTNKHSFEVFFSSLPSATAKAFKEGTKRAARSKSPTRVRLSEGLYGARSNKVNQRKDLQLAMTIAKGRAAAFDKTEKIAKSSVKINRKGRVAEERGQKVSRLQLTPLATDKPRKPAQS